jgi:hypothetical protein
MAGAVLAATAVAALVTIVPQSTRTTDAQAAAKKATERNALNSIASTPPLSDVGKSSAPALIPGITQPRVEFVPGAATASVSSVNSPFISEENLLFLAEPMSSEELRENQASALMRESERPSIGLVDDAISSAAPPALASSSEPNAAIPFPPPRPIIRQHNQTRTQSPRSNDTTAMAIMHTAPFAPLAWLKKLFPSWAASDTPVLPPQADSQTAVYDIVEHVVYLPDGERLEAHSGLSKWLDDPRSVNLKARGPTPPNIYRLTLREKPFHGVRAIRLNPVGNGQMYGRKGVLAHTYMLGPNGQSNGCISFKDYPKFLRAYLKGDIKRLIVVAHLEKARPKIDLAANTIAQ